MKKHILDGKFRIAAALIAFVSSAVLGAGSSIFGLVTVFEYGSVQISFSQADVTAMQNATTIVSFPAQLTNSDGSVFDIPEADLYDNNPQVGERILEVQLNDSNLTPGQGLGVFVYNKPTVTLSADGKIIDLVVDLTREICRGVSFNPGQYSLTVVEYETIEDFRTSNPSGYNNGPAPANLGHSIALVNFTMPQLPTLSNCTAYGHEEDQFNENTMEIVYVSDSNVAFKIKRFDDPNSYEDDAGFFHWNLEPYATNAYYEFLIKDSTDQVLFKTVLNADKKGVKEFKDAVDNITNIEYQITDPTLVLKPGSYTAEMNFVKPSYDGSEPGNSTLVGREEFNFGQTIESASISPGVANTEEKDDDGPPKIASLTNYFVLPGDRSDDEEEEVATNTSNSSDSGLADEIEALADEVSELSEDVANLTEGGGSGASEGSNSASNEAPVRCFDVEPQYWGYGIVNSLLDLRLYPIIRINNTNICRPLSPVLRKEFTAWLLEVYDPEESSNIAAVDMTQNPFSDLNALDPYAPYIIKAAELGIVHGYPDGTFKPDLQINRAETLKILLRSSHLFNALSDEVSLLKTTNLNAEPEKRFNDVYDNQWYYSYLYYAIANDIIQGYEDGTARMEQGVIFGEAAKILYLARELEGVL